MSREAPDDEVHWSCPECQDAGVVVNWRSTRWDRTPDVDSGRLISLLRVRAERGRSRECGHEVCTYDLLVELVAGPLDVDEPVSRTLRLSGEATLHDLHELLRQAFDREDDEPYEFMFGAPYEPEARRFAGGLTTDDQELWETQLLPLDALELDEDQKFGYLFDFGEEWVHRVTVLVVRTVEGPVEPEILDRTGCSPPQYPDGDDLWQDELIIGELDEDYPLSGLYGPYLAEEAPDSEMWLSMDELERQLLVLEAHARQDNDHPPVSSMTLHAVIHSLAETSLAEDSSERARIEARRRQGLSRHQAIHELGTRLVGQLLEETQAPQERLKKRSNRARGKARR